MQKKLPGFILFGLGLAAALAFVPGTFDAGIWPRWVALAVLAPLALMLIDDEVAPPGLLLVAVAAAALSILWSPDLPGGLDDLAHYLILAACFWLGFEASDLRPLWVGAGLGVALNALLAVAQVFGFDGVAQVAVPGGLFVNPNLLGEASAVVAAASLALGLWTYALLAVIVVLLSGSKAAIGGLLLAFALWVSPRFPAIARLVVSLVAVAIALMILGGHPSFIVRLDDIWMPLLSDLRVFGHGVGGYAFAFPGHEWAHNEPLQAVYELGLLAVPLGMIALYGLVWSLHDPRRAESLVFVVIAFTALAGFPLHVPFTALAGAVATGALLGTWAPLRRRRHDFRAEACASA